MEFLSGPRGTALRRRLQLPELASVLLCFHELGFGPVCHRGAKRKVVKERGCCCGPRVSGSRVSPVALVAAAEGTVGLSLTHSLVQSLLDSFTQTVVLLPIRCRRFGERKNRRETQGSLWTQDNLVVCLCRLRRGRLQVQWFSFPTEFISELGWVLFMARF